MEHKRIPAPAPPPQPACKRSRALLRGFCCRLPAGPAGIRQTGHDLGHKTQNWQPSKMRLKTECPLVPKAACLTWISTRKKVPTQELLCCFSKRPQANTLTSLQVSMFKRQALRQPPMNPAAAERGRTTLAACDGVGGACCGACGGASRARSGTSVAWMSEAFEAESTATQHSTAQLHRAVCRAEIWESGRSAASPLPECTGAGGRACGRDSSAMKFEGWPDQTNTASQCKSSRLNSGMTSSGCSPFTGSTNQHE